MPNEKWFAQGKGATSAPCWATKRPGGANRGQIKIVKILKFDM